VFDPQLYFSTVLTLFVILDPPGLLPVFLGLTRGMPAEARRASARNAAVVAFGIICVFAVFGRFILDYLHITIEALQVSGGLLLLLVAMQLLTGSAENEALESGTNIAIVPLGIPLLAGPGSIVAMMLAVDAARGDTVGLRHRRNRLGDGDVPGVGVPAVRRRHQAGPARVGHRVADPDRRHAAGGDRGADARRRDLGLPEADMSDARPVLW
jgi:hypothetical protein